MVILVTFFGILLVFLFVGIPVGFSMGILAIILGAIEKGISNISYTMIAQRMMYGVNSFPILAIPAFMLAARIMNEGTVTNRIFDLADVVVGRLRGGLGHVNVLASMIFAGMSGSAAADAAGLGAIEIKAMKEAGYSLKFSTAVTGASSIIGPIIPPSITMVIYGMLADVSVAALFIGGIIPGVMLGLSMMIYIYFISMRRKYPYRSKPLGWKIVLNRITRAVPSLGTPVIIVGGIWSGIFTPTEAAMVAVAYALFLTIILYREVSLKRVVHLFREVSVFTGIIMFILAAASAYTWFLTRARIPMIVSEGLLSISSNPVIVMLVLIPFFLLIGCFMNVIAALMILTPIFAPGLSQLGVDPIHFGLIMVITLGLGVITPPVGSVLYILVEISGLPFETVSRSFVPFLVPILITILLLVFFPSLTTFLPNWLLYS